MDLGNLLHLPNLPSPLLLAAPLLGSPLFSSPPFFSSSLLLSRDVPHKGSEERHDSRLHPPLLNRRSDAGDTRASQARVAGKEEADRDGGHHGCGAEVERARVRDQTLPSVPEHTHWEYQQAAAGRGWDGV